MNENVEHRLAMAIADVDDALFAYLRAAPEERERFHSLIRRTGVSMEDAAAGMAALARGMRGAAT